MQTDLPARRKTWLTVLPWALVAALLVTNAATLLNAQAQATAFGAVDRLLSVLGDKARLTIVASSLLMIQEARVAARVNEEKALTQRAEQALRAANKRVGDLEVEKNALSQRLSKHKAIARRVGSEGVKKLAVRSARAVSTVPARMMPYVGIAAEAGFLAWELQVDCELASSLAELLRDSDGPAADIGQVCGWVQKTPSPQQIWADVKKKSDGALRKLYEGLESRGL